MIILIDNYDSFAFNLVHYLGELGAVVEVHRNDKVTPGAVMAAEPDAIVLSPGPCTPDDAGICLDLIEKAAAVFGLDLGTRLNQGRDRSISFTITTLLDKKILLLTNKILQLGQILEFRTEFLVTKVLTDFYALL